MEAEMHITSGATATSLLAIALIATALPAQQIDTPAQTMDAAASVKTVAPLTDSQDSTPAHAYSKVRIVRLSEVKGDVQLDRYTGVGFEQAMANIPIIEHAQIQTGVGVAEIEFEDNSTLRVGPNSLVAFPQLELLPSGGKASTVTVTKGIAYVSLVNTKGNDFTLTFGQQKVHLQPSSHIRLQMEPTRATLTVQDGAALVEGPSGTTQIAKKKTFSFDLANQNPPVAAKYVPSEPYDSWDNHATEYHKGVASQSAFGNSPYSYGTSDMAYYGSFVNAPGCGSMWQPYFVSASWSPFANGTWAYYPGAGYSWISPYPWGWTPFHYGSWTSCPGAGWGWQPGGLWNGLGNGPVATTTTNGILLPSRPVRAPLTGESTLVPVNQKPLTISEFGSASRESFVLSKDTAGMGIPRGNFGKLGQFSEQTVRHGTAIATVYGATPASAQGGARPGYAGPDASSRSGYSSSMERPASGTSSSPSFGPRTSGAPVSSAPVSGATPGGGRPR
jgi:hypothetical protein